MKANIVLDIASYWLVGTGRGAGPEADSVAAKDACGLPYVPGKSLKGLLREAMEATGVPAGRIVQLMGSQPTAVQDGDEDTMEDRIERHRYQTTEGSLHVSSARLSDEWRNWAGTVKSAAVGQWVIESLFTTLASTAIDEEGRAKKHSLRTIQVAVPMVLRAVVEGPDGEDWVSDMRQALSALRFLGSHRNRGLGRVKASLEVVS